jgi:hypothetical protein
MAEEEKVDEVKAFSTSGDTPLDGEPQSVPTLAEPVPGTELDDHEEAGQSPG